MLARFLSAGSGLLAEAVSTSGRALAAASGPLSAAASCSRAALSSSAAPRPGIFGTALLERLPQVAPPLPDWAVAHAEWSERWHAGERVVVKGDVFEEKEASALEEENLATSWAPGARETEADKAGDIKSLRRKMDRRLYLILKSKVEGTSQDVWHFPSAQAMEGETIRATAERALANSVGSSIETWFVGNSPMGHLLGKVNGEDSARFFFMKAQILDGEVALPSGKDAPSEHAWVCKEELPQYLPNDAQTKELLEKMLPDL